MMMMMMMMMSGECALCARWSGIILGFHYGILVIPSANPKGQFKINRDVTWFPTE